MRWSGESAPPSPCGPSPASPYPAAMSTPSIPKRARSACPLCGAAAVAAHSPFCSRGCRDRDLLNWLGDAYRVPGAPAAASAADEGLDSEG